MSLQLIIVEDEPLEKRALRQIIQRNFPEIAIVSEPSDGLEALREIEKWRPDLLFLDIGIPEIDGLTVQQKALELLPNIQSVVLTAYSDFDHVHKALTNQVVDYLVKPARSSQIVAAVQKLLNNLNSQRPTPEVAPASQNENIQKAVSYIQQNYFREIQQKDVANMLFLHPQYLSRLFKKELGMTFGEYLNNLRIEKSKELLVQTNMPIYVVASECGFTDSAYYCKKFNQLTKTTPLKYRKNRQMVNA